MHNRSTKSQVEDFKSMRYVPSHILKSKTKHCQSSTWEDMGTFAVGLGSNLNYTGQGLYGLDTVGLGLPTNPGIKLPGQVVGGKNPKSSTWLYRT